MNQSRLLLLADALRTRIPANHFDMSDWRSRKTNANDVDDAPVSMHELLEHQCGTAACAVGWACVMPEFIAQGLYADSSTPRFKHHEFIAQGLYADSSTPRFKHHEHWAAVHEFFDISNDTANALFLSSFYPQGVTPIEVAERIELAVKEGDEAAHDAGLVYARQR